MNMNKLNVQEQVKLILDIANILRGPFKEDEYQEGKEYDYFFWE